MRGSNHFSVKTSTNYPDTTGSTFDHSGLPSPPLSTSPQRRNSVHSTAHMTSSSICANSNTPMPLRSFIEIVMKKSHMDTGTLLTSLCYARRLKLKLFSTSKGSCSQQTRLSRHSSTNSLDNRHGMHSSPHFLGNVNNSNKIYPRFSH